MSKNTEDENYLQIIASPARDLAWEIRALSIMDINYSHDTFDWYLTHIIACIFIYDEERRFYGSQNILLQRNTDYPKLDSVTEMFFCLKL